MNFKDLSIINYSPFLVKDSIEWKRNAQRISDYFDECFKIDDLMPELAEISKDFSKNTISKSLAKIFKENALKLPKDIDILNLLEWGYFLQKKLKEIYDNSTASSIKDIDGFKRSLYLSLGYGDFPNIQEEVPLEEKGWITGRTINKNIAESFILQTHEKNPDIARLLKAVNGRYTRVAQGRTDAMTEKQKRLARKEFIEPGDIIVIDRHKFSIKSMKEMLDKLDKGVHDKSISLPLYAHFGIYLCNGCVLHFSSPGKGDMDGEKYIHEGPLKEFLDYDNTEQEKREIYIAYVSGDGAKPYKLFPDSSALKFNPAHIEFWDFYDYSKLKCYSPKETVKRAKKVEKDCRDIDYNMLLNNCEDFAFYCKTGVRLSQQRIKLETIFKIITYQKAALYFLISTAIEKFENCKNK